MVAVAHPEALHASWRADAGLAARNAGMIERSGALGILFAGFLTNARDLARQLGLPQGGSGDVARLVLAGYERWREGVAGHLEGAFACVLETPDGGALAFTDPLGMVPLYHTSGLIAGEVHFANHLIDLLADRSAQTVDEEYLADFLVHALPSGARSPFVGISRVPSGSYLVINPTGIATRRYWSIGRDPALAMANECDLAELLVSRLDGALRPLAAQFSSVCCELSGGLDSSTVTCMAARAGFGSLATWSVFDPRNQIADEREWIDHVAAATGIAGELIDISQQLPFSADPGAFIGEPYLGVINRAQFEAKNALLESMGTQLLLTGFAGDIVLGASPGPFPLHLADPLFGGDLLSTWRGMRNWARHSWDRRSTSFWAMHCIVKPAWQHLCNQAVTVSPVVPLQPWLSPDFCRRFGLSKRARRRIGERRQTPGDQTFAGSVLAAAFQASIEWQRRRPFATVHPLLDRQLIETMFSVPIDLKLRPRCDRYLQRRALNGILPEPIRRRGGKGIGTPVFVEGLARAPQWIDFLANNSALVARGIATQHGWRAALEQASVGQTNGDMYLHAAIAAEVWLRQLDQFRTQVGASHRPAADLATGRPMA